MQQNDAKIGLLGVSSQVGQHVAEMLAGMDVPYQSLSRAPKLSETYCDLDKPESVRAALIGLDKALLLSADTPRQLEQQIRFIAIAKECGVNYIVKISAIVAEYGMSFGKDHLAIERALINSGLKHTIIRPTFFMQTFFNFKNQISQGRLIFSAAGAVAFVDVADLAAVVVSRLLKDDINSELLTVTGPESLTFSQVSELFSHQLDISVKHLKPPKFVARLALAMTTNMGWWMSGQVIELMKAIDLGYEDKITDDVYKVLNREPQSFKNFITRNSTYFDA